MTVATVGTLLGLALVDALNPSTILQATVLSAGRRPVRAVMAFWSGALLAYLVLGTLLVLGPARFIENALTDPPRALRLAGLAVGPALITAAIIGFRRARKNAARASRPSPLRQPRTRLAFGLGVLSTAVDAFTAVPYLAAATIVSGQGLPTVGKVLILLGYNVVYLSPVLAVLGLRLIFGRRVDPVVDRVMGTLERHGPVLVGLLAVIGGTALTVIGATAL